MPRHKKSLPTAMPQDRPPNPVQRVRTNPIFNPQTVVDVIIPVSPKHKLAFNTAVRSIEKQTLPSPLWRIIAINDTDDELVTPRDDIFVVDNLGPHGSSYARNLGIKAARAPFVCFLDADDYMLNTTLELFLKGYVQLDTGYVYGDAILALPDGSMRDFIPQLQEMHVYDQQHYLKGNFHVVTSLIPTDLARDVMFDERINLWEDYEFYMHMAAKGYCGTRIPYPMIIYNQHAGQNFANANALEANGIALTQQIKDKWKGSLEGRPRMACCGGSKEQAQKAREALNRVTNIANDGDVHMEWMGANQGSVSYRSPNVTNRLYNVGALDPNRFFAVAPADVEWMLSMGARIVPKPSVPIVIPTAGEFLTAQQVGSTVTMGSEASVVVPQGSDMDFEEITIT